MATKFLSRLNPCFNGILKYSGLFTDNFSGRICLNPCFNGILKYKDGVEFYNSVEAS